MSYKKLKEDLINIIELLDNISDEELKNKELNKESIMKDLIQYMIFFEELEQQIKRNRTTLENHKDKFKIIKKYLIVLEKLIK